MKRFNAISFATFLVLFVFGCEKHIYGCEPPPKVPLFGNWNRTKSTYGLTQKTVTPAEAGYSETISFEDDSFRQIRNGVSVRTTNCSYVFPKGGNIEGLIYFIVDPTQQSFQVADNKLFLSERGPVGAVIADGATYEYNR